MVGGVVVGRLAAHAPTGQESAVRSKKNDQSTQRRLAAGTTMRRVTREVKN